MRMPLQIGWPLQRFVLSPRRQSVAQSAGDYLRSCDRRGYQGCVDQGSRRTRASLFGEISVAESLGLLRMEKLNDDDAAMLASGLETLVGVLGTLREKASDDNAGPVH